MTLHLDLRNLALLALFGVAGATFSAASPRERIPLNDGWRFQQDDPPGNTVELRHDVRPEIEQRRDDGPADARPQEAAQVATAAPAVLKPWILPTCNAFINDSARRHVRPAGNPGGEVDYVRAGFDDSPWQRVTLPHDWAISGPFLETGNHGGMGQLPSWGIGWYRRIVDIPATDAGKSIFLEVDGAMSYTTVWVNGHLIGGWPFGYSSWRVDPEHGVFVNGERILLQGVNVHHDLGALGAAFNVRAAERQLEMLREMGCNAVRMAAKPHAPEVLELTGRMGLLVFNDSCDVWERRKTPLDFHLIFPNWGEADMRALVRRDRNSPSVIMWSIGNEVGEQYTGEAGASVGKRLHDIVREEDPTRPTTTAMNWAKPDMPLPAVVDIISLNYQGEGIRQEPEFEGTDRIRTPPQYPAFRAIFPDKVIVSSETASAFSSRGVYLFPVSPLVSAPVRDGRGGDSTIKHVSAYELHAVDFGSTADKVFASLDRHPYVAGEFVWSGWDYLGEPTPYYAARSSYCGIIDLAGFKKDRFYLYQARWRPDHPMAHILPHWTWPDRVAEVTPVHEFTSGDEAELFLNGRSLGRKKRGAYEYRLRWDDVVYEPGRLDVVAYKGGLEWAQASVQTAGDAAALDLQPDRTVIHADGSDLSFVTVRVTDANGATSPRADNALHFTIEGPGEIVATDNGDPTSFEPFQAPQRKTFSGLCLVIIRAKSGEAGSIRLTASGDGLQSGNVTITAGM